MSEQVERDPDHPQVVRDADGTLAALNRAGALDAADVHVAQTVGRLASLDDEPALLALALVVRALRLGSSALDLHVAVADLALEAPDVGLPPMCADVDGWWRHVATGPLASGRDAVLVAEAPLLGLARYDALEAALTDLVVARMRSTPPVIDEVRLGTDLDRLFPPADDFSDQRSAAERAVRSATSIVTGGPGTGKTTTIARLLVALRSQHEGRGPGRPFTVGLAAPTGKAAARMRAAIAAAADTASSTGESGLSGPERAWLASLPATTIHRLLGPLPATNRFRHHAGQRLPHDVVVIDETSMVSLLMMERLVQAVPLSGRLVLVGDADQLASVEAGAVLRDVIDGLDQTPATAAGVASVTELTIGHRFTGAVRDLAEAVRRGDAEAALEVLRSGDDRVRLVPPDLVDDVITDRPAAQARAVARAAADGDDQAALLQLAEHRLLCAHRDGPSGASRWNERLEREVRQFPDALRPWFVGRPVLITRNDAGLRINNGDVGVTVEADDRLVVRLETGTTVAAARVTAAQSAYASTVHRAQGSEFEHVTLLLPADDSAVLTRELIYTAVTRTRSTLTVVATPEIVRRAIDRPTARASGIARRLRTALS